MKKLRIAAAVFAAFALLLTACVNTPASDKAGVYVPGTYTASGQGFGGAVDVSVTVDANKITAVSAKGDNETEGIGSMAIEELPAKIVAANGKVDVVAGATYIPTPYSQPWTKPWARPRARPPNRRS
ncbi:MAG: FMN-binding protein [Spirochaetales bacterium]|nr:FMN-binding protein [Spirochaetales bacterium]